MIDVTERAEPYSRHIRGVGASARHRLALFCFLGRGHLDPMIAVGRRLAGRGHDVTVFHLAIAQAAVERAGLKFAPLDNHEPDGPDTFPARWSLKGFETAAHVTRHAVRVLREAPAALASSGIDAVVGDQLDIAAGTVAELAGVPHVTVCCAPPIYLHPALPPPYFRWQASGAWWARARNRFGNAAIRALARPAMTAINHARRNWGLRDLRRVDDAWSVPMIAQLPESLEFERPPEWRGVVYTGQFRDDHPAAAVRFPWHQLDGRPLIYASMGTIRNRDAQTFRTIADAVSEVDAQLVLSLGGGRLLPSAFSSLPSNTLCVHYAPQRALLRRAVLVVNCAGLNTTLDALHAGVPIVGIPVAEDQPGVAARIDRAGVGAIVPAHRLNRRRLREAIERVLREPDYRRAALRYRTAFAAIDGAGAAATAIEAMLGDPTTRRKIA